MNKYGIILKKLKICGVTFFNFLRDYLFDRRQMEDSGGFRNKEKVISHGVPRGTMLGPMILHDLLDMENEGKIISFADYIVVQYHVEI